MMNLGECPLWVESGLSDKTPRGALCPRFAHMLLVSVLTHFVPLYGRRQGPLTHFHAPGTVLKLHRGNPDGPTWNLTDAYCAVQHKAYLG